jgi:lysine 6-dehydrogenase
MFDMKPIEVDGCLVVPRHVFHALFEPVVAPEEGRDVCVEHVRAVGQRDGRPAEAVVDLVDYYDPATGFTAMERLTGWHAAIAAEMIARGDIRPGAHSVEAGIPAGPFVEECRRRGLAITERVEYLDRT